MKWLFTFMIIISVFCSIITGKPEEFTNSLIENSKSAVDLSISLLGMMCFWSGIMQVAKSSGFTEILSRFFKPITKLLFKNLSKEETDAITMNMSANFLGLGNAATPFGLNAMEKLQKSSLHKDTATDNMITFVVLNTCSIQLIPTTVAVLRQNMGSENPMEILPAVIATSMITAFCALFVTKLCNRLFPLKRSK